MGVMVTIISYPLIKGNVKMNYWYGVRFPQSFYSDESWYKINAYGGKVLTIWGLFLVATGILIIFIPLNSRQALFAVFIGAYATIIVPIIIIFNYARRFKRQPAESVKRGI
jgi:hypothetical protein